MLDYHGLLVVEENGYVHNEFETIIDSHIQHCYRGKYYIHDDSLHLLNPIEEDVIVNSVGCPSLIRSGGYGCIALTDISTIFKPQEFQIIQRNGRPFFWPDRIE